MSSYALLKYRAQPWQAVVCAFVCAYLTLGVATSSLRTYHWFMLLAIPGAFLSAERGRRFFLDWAPLFAFWLIYDRLRLIQPMLYGRVAVEQPFLVERALFGWMAKGDIPAHAAHAWLTAGHGVFIHIIGWAAQLTYFSHLLLMPLVIGSLWVLGAKSAQARNSFLRYVRAFSLLNFAAIGIYLLIPAAPPWWVTLHETSLPSADLVLHTDLTSAMHGRLIQAMIKNASQWFAAIPSLHGAYPALLLMLAWRSTNRRVLAGLALYLCAMWAATVFLNQHYVIDLIVGALLAIVAWCLERFLVKSGKSLDRNRWIS